MKAIAGCLFLIAIAIAGITAALGCWGGVIDVAQPLVSPDEGIVVSTVSYSLSCVPGLVIPGYEISFVGRANCVCQEYSGKSENINAAKILGITATVDTFHMSTNKLLGDTLHAIIDLSHMKPMTDSLSKRLSGFPVDAVVKATVESVLLTAYNHRTGITGVGMPGSDLVQAKYIRLEIRGPSEYDSLAGVFSFEALGRLPRQRVFW